MGRATTAIWGERKPHPAVRDRHAAGQPMFAAEVKAVGSRTDSRLRVLMYSHNGFGLGHLKRTTNIAARFVKEVPTSSVLMLVGSPAGVSFPLPPGVDFVKVPSIIKLDSGVWRPRSLHIGREMAKALRASMIQKAAEIFMPNLFLVDYIPTGVWGELLPTLQMLKEREHPAKVVLGLRDILDAPDVTRELWRQEDAYEALKTYYDCVFIYGCEEIFDTASQYGLSGALARKVKYCGYLCSEEACKPNEQMRDELQIKKDKFIVVTGGGGYDAYPMMRTCMEAFQRLGAAVPYEAIVIAGPLMEDEQREWLRKQAEGLPVRVLRYAEDHLGFLNAADLVISMAGYNTLLEAVRLRKRVLVVPREGPSVEQRIRAEMFSRLGLVHAIPPEELSPSVLAQAIGRNLDTRPVPLLPLNMDGLSNVVRDMMRLLQMDSRALSRRRSHAR